MEDMFKSIDGQSPTFEVEGGKKIMAVHFDASYIAPNFTKESAEEMFRLTNELIESTKNISQIYRDANAESIRKYGDNAELVDLPDTLELVLDFSNVEEFELTSEGLLRLPEIRGLMDSRGIGNYRRLANPINRIAKIHFVMPTNREARENFNKLFNNANFQFDSDGKTPLGQIEQFKTNGQLNVYTDLNDLASYYAERSKLKDNK